MDEYGWNSAMDMTLMGKLKEDLEIALRNKDAGAKDAIRIVKSEFFKLTVPITLESGKKTTRPKKDDEITNDDILGIIISLTKSERVLLAAKKESSSRYLEILQAYLPQMASQEEVAAWIRENVDFSQFKNAMQAMGPIMKHFGNKADGNLVKKVLQDIGAR